MYWYQRGLEWHEFYILSNLEWKSKKTTNKQTKITKKTKIKCEVGQDHWVPHPRTNLQQVEKEESFSRVNTRPLNALLFWCCHLGSSGGPSVCVLVSCFFCNILLQTWWLKTFKMYFLTALEVRSPNWTLKNWNQGVIRVLLLSKGSKSDT